MAARVLYLTVVISTLFGALLGCPTVCTCSVRFRHYFVDCSYRDLVEIPTPVPPNVSTISFSANKISMVPQGIFDNVTQMLSLWMGHNEIVSIEPGSLTPMVLLRNLDISHNKIVDFPWGDLQNLTALQFLKMNHNELVTLPRDAFVNLKNLRSLRLNNNKFSTIAEGTFDSLMSLSHLQLFDNPFACTCYIDWFRDWLSTTTISIPQHNLINCATPATLEGEMIVNLPASKCTHPNVTIWTEPNIDHRTLYEGDDLVLHCEYQGTPEPLVTWNIPSQAHELNQTFTENPSNDGSLLSNNSVQVFNNGTVILSHLSADVGGNYTCSASNEFGTAVGWIFVKVASASEQTSAKDKTTKVLYSPTQQPIKSTTGMFVFDSVSPTKEMNPQPFNELIAPFKCGLKAKKIHTSSQLLNGSSDDTNPDMFDFGVITLWVSETEATIRLNSVLIPRDTQENRTAATVASSEGPHNATENDFEEIPSRGLYLCVTTEHEHSPVLWSLVKEGLSTYQLSGLRPDTNYSLCLTREGEDCEVQVLFSTKKKVPNLIIIISVSICLLTVSTVPLLGAICYHLVHKYRSKTYKLMLKARDQYQMERNRASTVNIPPLTESQRNIHVHQLDEEDGGTESLDGEKEADTEESVMTDTATLSHSKGNLEDCEVGSDFSDRLPLGAEAVSITSN
ncbi:immunoglobulin superfamily containing leucine-rich repeat protein 2-like [Syngnathoides biaculeatus]|uniref:immunoglobulin superfamily containing leucine-rich repeat protein 2-like n=1 Tax=Syngnathoides biaculeatus TaxID=300417 RepID=UPI002ADE8537|nr:immunoglobulin superfamily containing leucine-rich repeat protein 2-like [Syngnathoides biaculeatus]XP_061671342.1 immunoglobulin superfamily containing leucine-rich repeat protein 2-like [Syngnathoides biaculeatus]